MAQAAADSIKNAKRIVFKVGTSTLTYESGKANIRHVANLVQVLCDLSNSGKEIILVTSGAIGIGIGKMGLEHEERDTPLKQAAACVGQCELMFMYDKFFSEYGKIVGQLLVTRSDIDNEERRRNLVNAFDKMIKHSVIPVINENDSVAIEEIVFGDNDNLSAIIAKLVGADLLVILSDIDGLYDADPNKKADAKIIPVVREINDDIYALAGGVGSKRGTGGMVTKIQAAKIATDAGIDTVILNGSNPLNIYKMIDGEEIGTVFHRK